MCFTCLNVVHRMYSCYVVAWTVCLKGLQHWNMVLPNNIHTGDAKKKITTSNITLLLGLPADPRQPPPVLREWPECVTEPETQQQQD